MKRRDLLKLSGAAASGWALFPKLAAAEVSAAPAALFSKPIPSLPQHATGVASLARRAGLIAKQATYTWTERAPNVKGVPMSSIVPYEELPTLEWLLKTTKVIIDIVVNALAWLLKGAASAALQGLQQRLQQLQASYAELEQSYDSLVAQHAGSYSVNGSVALQALQLQQSALNLFAHLGQLRDQVLELIPEDQAAPAAAGDAGLDRYKAMFQTIPLPEIAEHIFDDEWFAYLRVAGPNPVLLKSIDILPAKFPLTDAQYQQVMGGGDNLSLAGLQGRLYLLDYVDLGSLAPTGVTHKPMTGDSYVSAPIALFAIPPGGGALQPVAIQCQQDSAAGPVFLRASAPDSEYYWGWQLAKKAVQTADFNYHEIFVHLGRAHLVSEAFSIATQRRLPSHHPLNVLLLPHLEGDIFVNDKAAKIIMNKFTIGDIVLSAPIEGAQQSAGRERLDFDFYQHMPPNDFKIRGVEAGGSLVDYPYRDDALLIWGAIHDWVEAYLALYYSSDADVVSDTELADWSDELIRKGKVKGFRSIQSLAQLVEVVTMIIFNASAQHAAVNFTQASMMVYAPAYAGMSAVPAPTRVQGHTEADWDATPPGSLTSIVQLSFLHVLGSVYYRPLGDYRGRYFPYPQVFTDARVTAADGPLESFRNRLREVEAAIEARNAKRSRPYPYLLPSKIPSSTNI